MNKKYEKYYNSFLGVNIEELEAGKVVFSSKQRDIPLNRKYYCLVIGTVISGKIIFSVTPSLFDKLNKFIGSKIVGNLAYAKELLSEFSRSECKVEVRSLYRLGLPGKYRAAEINNVHVFTEEILKRRIGELALESQKIALKNNAMDIKEKRKFEIDEDGKLASMAKISDVDFGGGNITVYTNENYRKKGYGKLLVHACIDWCSERDVLPIYLVDQSNAPSLNLAKGIGFEIFSEELIISMIK